MDTTQAITLVGVLVAAVTGIVGSALALLNYKRSGKREELAWRRSALVAALNLFLESSFGILSRDGLKTRQSGDTDRVERARRRAITKHTELVKAQTSLRLLADGAVVRLAQQAHDLIDEGYDLIFDGDVPATSSDLDAVMDKLRDCRTALLTACRANLGLDEAVPIARPTPAKGPSSLDEEENERVRTEKVADELVAALVQHGYLGQSRAMEAR